VGAAAWTGAILWCQRARARALALEIANGRQEVVLSVSGMMCEGSCAAKVRTALGKVSGVVSARASAAEGRAVVVLEKRSKSGTYVSVDALIKAVKAVGFPATELQMRQLAIKVIQGDLGIAKKILEGVSGIYEVIGDNRDRSSVIRLSADQDLHVAKAIMALEEKGILAMSLKSEKRNVTKARHACLRGIVSREDLDEAFEGVKKHFHEQQLTEYSRYKNWTQSCYMECHDHWSPQVEVEEALRASMAKALEICGKTFGEWYKDLHGLKDVEVYTLNSFVTKYIPQPGKDEFGKHVDSAKVDGSLILALPTDKPHDWPGLIVWDGAKNELGKRPEQKYILEPGDVCCLDALIWHHGLPITRGCRYVAVCFYGCKWKK